MINVTLGEVKTQEEKPFPKLMISDSGIIVYFTSNRCGIALNDELLTDYSEEWNMQFFTDYNEPVTLQNK